jgi:hypothetical protein
MKDHEQILKNAGIHFNQSLDHGPLGHNTV